MAISWYGAVGILIVAHALAVSDADAQTCATDMGFSIGGVYMHVGDNAVGGGLVTFGHRMVRITGLYGGDADGTTRLQARLDKEMAQLKGSDLRICVGASYDRAQIEEMPFLGTSSWQRARAMGIDGSITNKSAASNTWQLIYGAGVGVSHVDFMTKPAGADDSVQTAGAGVSYLLFIGTAKGRVQIIGSLSASTRTQLLGNRGELRATFRL